MANMRDAVKTLAQKPVMTKFLSRYLDPIDQATRRLTGGRVTASGWLLPELALHSLGAKSGQWRENILLYVRDEQGNPVVVGTNFGGDSHPGWTYNLLANPSARIVLDRQEQSVAAQRLTAEEMASMWPRFDAVYSGYIGYRERIGDSREIRMFRLAPA